MNKQELLDQLRAWEKQAELERMGTNNDFRLQRLEGEIKGLQRAQSLIIDCLTST